LFRIWLDEYSQPLRASISKGTPAISTIYSRIGPAHPRIGKFIYSASRFYYRTKFALQHIFDPDSRFARERVKSMQTRLARGETVYLAGLGVAGHNSGAALLDPKDASPELHSAA
jgi:carbamoyltransferase